MFAVYKVTGAQSAFSYYGYAEGETTDVKQAFLKGALRSENERGDVRFINSNNGSVDVTVTVVDVATDEAEAVYLRNKHRIEDVASITGPTMFPCKAAERAAADHPEQAKRWVSHAKLAGYKTARQAYEAGAYGGYPAIKQLCTQHRLTVIEDALKTMSPVEFARTYNVPLC